MAVEFLGNYEIEVGEKERPLFPVKVCWGSSELTLTERELPLKIWFPGTFIEVTQDGISVSYRKPDREITYTIDRSENSVTVEEKGDAFDDIEF